MEQEIPWFDDYFPKKIGITKQTLKKGVLYRLRYKDPTGYIHRPKGGTSLEEARKVAKETQIRLTRQDWNEEEKKRIFEHLKVINATEEEQSTRLTLELAIERYIKSTQRGSRPNTKTNLTAFFNRILVLFQTICPQKQYLDEITSEDIEDVLSYKKSTVFKRNEKLKNPEDIVIDDHLRVIRSLFKFHVERGNLLKNPAIVVKYLCEGGQKSRDVIPTDEEVQKIYQALNITSKNHSSSFTPMKEIVHFLVESGARIGEVLAMEWRDIQDDMWIIREKTCHDGYHFKPKSKKSYREYFLTQEMKAILERVPKVSSFVFPKARVLISDQCPSKRAHPSNVAKCCKCPLDRDRNHCEYRIVNYSRVSSIRTAWTNVRKKANVSNILIHDLRRYNNDKLLESGLSNEESGALIGNTARVNEMHYDANKKKRLQRMANEKRQLVGQISPKEKSEK